MRKLLLTALLLLAAPPLWGQSILNRLWGVEVTPLDGLYWRVVSVYPQLSSRTALHIFPAASAPATCSPANGDVYFNTTTPALWICTAANTWTALSAGGGGTPGAPVGSLQWNSAGSFAGLTGSSVSGANVTFTGTVTGNIGSFTSLGTNFTDIACSAYSVGSANQNRLSCDGTNRPNVSRNGGAYEQIALLGSTNTAAAGMTLDMSAATGANAFRVPVGAGLTSGANGVLAYDSTANSTHFRVNAADAIGLGIASAPVGSRCLQSSGTTGLVTEAAAACGGAGTVTTTGSPASGQGAFFSGASSITSSANWLYASGTGHSLVQGANGADAFFMNRFTDTAPTGNFLHFQNAAKNVDEFKVDMLGNITNNDGGGFFLTAAGSIILNSGFNVNLTPTNGGAIRALGNLNFTNLLLGSAAPTISSGFGTSPSVTNNNGTGSFRINVGTGGTATTGVIGLPTATTGWNCQATDITTQNATVDVTKQIGPGTTTTVTIGNFTSGGIAGAWTASDILAVSCFAL